MHQPVPTGTPINERPMVSILVTVSKIVQVEEFDVSEAADTSLEEWYEGSFLAGDVSLDQGPWEPISYESVTVRRVDRLDT